MHVEICDVSCVLVKTVKTQKQIKYKKTKQNKTKKKPKDAGDWRNYKLSRKSNNTLTNNFSHRFQWIFKERFSFKFRDKIQNKYHILKCESYKPQN